MNLLEREVFASQSMLVQYIEYWHRYVDDVLCLWTGSNAQLNEFHQLSISPIKFTLELRGKSINFLDLSSTLQERKYVFEIFRKTTYSGVTIDGYFYCPLSHKNADFLTMIHQLVSTPLPMNHS